MPKFTKHLSPARARLRDAITAKAAGVADVALVQSRIDRLRSVVDSVEPGTAALAAFDSEYSAALATWARVTGSPLPKIDAEKRAKLVSAFDDATAQAAAAAAAMENMQADARAAADKASGAHKAVWVASRLVLLDEAQSTLEPLAKAIAAAFAEKRRIDAARQAVLAELRSDDETHREIFVGLGAFDRARPDAESVPHTPDTNEFHADWHALAAGLLQSAEAALGDAPVAPLPAHSRIEMPDPVIAAAQAAAAFESTSIQRWR